ncbi:hypothetical protein SAMN05421810_102307 [Amycolatopsis arida]|uniref:Uncharacterized protein n=1 Tax=Amycolatopsis arida TaxID=587909 RepID=A0A1I5PK70_9PSEU|nr:hypothetical protein CLV69_101307 [Amycolatopsis arida]SFP33941.1 hypothetical protein SAMN05421810_102307 [Amycolatopsis arida]
MGAVLALILEVYGGSRPVEQLRPLLANTLYLRLAARARTGTVRYTLRSLHLTRPAPGSLEVCGRISAAGRALALATRFEATGDRGWRCTWFGLVESRPPRRFRP